MKMKKEIFFTEMKKKSGEIFESVQVDPITGNYYIVIPEIAMNELSWYEDSQIEFSIEGNELILSEKVDE